MNDIPAFPQTHEAFSIKGCEGMTLRDFFAGQALAGLVVGCSGLIANEFSAYAKGSCNLVLAERAYILADVMLKTREKAQDG